MSFPERVTRSSPFEAIGSSNAREWSDGQRREEPSLWSTFWLLGANFAELGWPQSGEIDIVENIGREPTIAHGTIHAPGYSAAQSLGTPVF